MFYFYFEFSLCDFYFFTIWFWICFMFLLFELKFIMAFFILTCLVLLLLFLLIYFILYVNILIFILSFIFRYLLWPNGRMLPMDLRPCTPGLVLSDKKTDRTHPRRLSSLSDRLFSPSGVGYHRQIKKRYASHWPQVQSSKKRSRKIWRNF